MTNVDTNFNAFNILSNDSNFSPLNCFIFALLHFCNKNEQNLTNRQMRLIKPLIMMHHDDDAQTQCVLIFARFVSFNA